MLADAEAVMVWMDALAAVKMPNYVVQINHRKLLQSLATYAGVAAEKTSTIHRAIDKLDKIGREGVKDEMLRHEITPEAAERVLDLVALNGPAIEVLSELRARLSDIPMAQEGIADLESLFDYLSAMSADTRHYALNLALARGLDYYTGPVFEAQVKEPSIGSLGGGGRYDGLIGMFTGEDLPATGSSLGVERIVDVIQELGLVEPRGSVSDVLVTLFNEEMIGPSLGLVMALRRAEVNAEIYLDARRDLRRQLQYADKRGIPVVAFLGPDEVAQGKVNLRRIATGEQVTVDQTEIAAAVTRLLSDD
jgi:histidyl-tRNA synthetase